MTADVCGSPQERSALRGQCSLLQSYGEPISEFVAGVDVLVGSLKSTGLSSQCYARAMQSDSEVDNLCGDDITAQLDEFAENLQEQMRLLALAPLQEHSAAIASAIKQAKAFDEESEAHDAAKQKYLSLPKDSPLETRAHAEQDLIDRKAALALQLFDTKRGLADAVGTHRYLPQRALGELMVAQLAYHQSCARLLAAAMPEVTAVLEQAEARRAALEEERRADALVRSAMPQPQLRAEGSTLAEGWLQKGAFGLSVQHDAVKDGLNRLKPWNKRWFVLCDDGKLYYYKSAEDARSPTGC